MTWHLRLAQAEELLKFLKKLFSGRPGVKCFSHLRTIFFEVGVISVFFFFFAFVSFLCSVTSTLNSNINHKGNSKHISVDKIKVYTLSEWILHKIWHTLLHVIAILSYYSFFKLKMIIDIDILSKRGDSCNIMLKYYITVLIQQFTKILN